MSPSWLEEACKNAPRPLCRLLRPSPRPARNVTEAFRNRGSSHPAQQRRCPPHRLGIRFSCRGAQVALEGCRMGAWQRCAASTFSSPNRVPGALVMTCLLPITLPPLPCLHPSVQFTAVPPAAVLPTVPRLCISLLLCAHLSGTWRSACQQIPRCRTCLVRLGRQPLLPSVTGFQVLSWIQSPEVVYDAALAGRPCFEFFWSEGVSPCNHPVDSS